MQKLPRTPALQKGMISYVHTGQFSPSKSDMKGAPQLPVLDANTPFCVTIVTVMFMLLGIVVMAECNS